MTTSPEVFALIRRYRRAMAGGPPVWESVDDEQPRPARRAPIREAAAATPAPVGVTLAAHQFAQLLERVAARTAAAPVRESAPAATPPTPPAASYDYPDDWPQKPLHEFTPEERERFVDAHLVGATLRHGPAPLTAADVAAAVNPHST